MCTSCGSREFRSWETLYKACSLVGLWALSLLVQTLIGEIAEHLEREPHFAVYGDDLARVWPNVKGPMREKKVREFAEKHGWEVRFYKEGFCVIFAKMSSKPSL